MSRSARPTYALLLALLGVFVVASAGISLLPIDRTGRVLLHIDLGVAVGCLATWCMLREQRARIERDLYRVVREHVLYDSQFTAPAEEPTVVDFEARRAAGKEHMT